MLIFVVFYCSFYEVILKDGKDVTMPSAGCVFEELKVSYVLIDGHWSTERVCDNSRGEYVSCALSQTLHGLLLKKKN